MRNLNDLLFLTAKSRSKATRGYTVQNRHLRRHAQTKPDGFHRTR